MTEEELKEILKARDMLDAQPVPEISPESLHNILEAMGYAPRPWVGLTNEDRFEIRKRKWWDWEDAFDIDGFMQAIEAKLKEKNA
jgi:hypothetical protein